METLDVDRIPTGAARPARSSVVSLAVTLVVSMLVLIPPTVSLGQSPSLGDFVINEILADPASGLAGDANGDGIRDAYDDEFIEAVNVTAVVLDLSGLTLSDSDSVRHTFPAGTIAQPGCAVVVFGGGSPNGIFGGAIVQTASTGSLSLNNSGDSVTMLNGASEIDSFTYGGPGCEGDQNQSVTLDPDLTGTCNLHTQASGSGESLFSPGTRIDGSPFGDCGILVFADDFESGGTSNWSSTVGELDF